MGVVPAGYPARPLGRQYAMTPPFASGRLPAFDRTLLRQIRAEQLRMLFGNHFATLLATAFAALLAMYAADHHEPRLAQWWFGIKVLAVVPRIALVEAFKARGSHSSRRWHQWGVALVLVDSLAWGLAAFMLFPPHDQLATTVIAASLMGVAALATFTLHANWLANLAYCGPMIVPTAVMLMAQQDTFGMFAGGALLVFVSGLLSVAYRAQQNIVELLWRRFTTDRVAEQRAEALREAERQNAIKSQFVATMSHELRTPLHGILGLTRILENHIQDDAISKQLGLIERSGEHLLSIINHILDFSRIEAGHLLIDEQAFDLSALLDDVIQLTRVGAASKQLSLVDDVRLARPCWVRGDAPKVRQVLLNLVGNAIKFTERGEVKVEAYRRGREGPIVVRVEDSGIGITEIDLPHIFDPYRQAGTATGRAVGGTGLGLTISREICRAMQGDITCSSRVGVGSTFEFSAPLPATPAPKDASRHELAAAAWRSPSPAALAGEAAPALHGHVLLAEDNDVNAMIVEAQLSRQGLTVEHVTDGQAALDRLQRSDLPPPDLVLMDCQMPRLDGFEATRRWRQFERAHSRSPLPVVALTASAMAEDSERCLHAGMNAHLPKPFHDHQLSAILERFLPRAPEPPAQGSSHPAAQH